jgi:transposase
VPVPFSIYRGTLFLGVLTAIRYDENFKIYFERLKARGKHTTCTQIAIMRKMIVIAHSLYKNDTIYNKGFYRTTYSNQELKCS